MTYKFAIIRNEKTRECPYGLPIIKACQTVGAAIDNMTPLATVADDQKDKYRKANQRVMIAHFTNERCPFADKIAVDKKSVNCDFGDNGQRETDFPIRPHPFYPRIFHGIGQYGLYSYPLSQWVDDQAARQLFSGIYSVYASTGEIQINKKNLLVDNELHGEYIEEISS